MHPVVPPADGEKAVIAYLTAQLPAQGITGAHVSTKVPNPLVLPLVTVRHDGGGSQDLVTYAARFTIQTWASTPQAAHDVAAAVAALMHAASGEVTSGVTVNNASVASMTNLPDPETDTPRWVVTCEWLTRAA